MKKVMLFIDLAIFALALAFDQLTKYLAIIKLKGNEAFVIINGVFEFDYLENRGSAFGIMEGQKILILFINIIFMAAILFVIFRLPASKKYIITHVFLTLICAGGIGNIIDRLRFDFVVDFLSFVLIDYPIFNVADCYVVVSTIGLFIIFMFVYKEDDFSFLNFKPSHYREIK